MKYRKVVVWLCVLMLVGGTAIFADAAVQKVRVIINGQSGDGGLVMDGKTYLPLREVASGLNAIVDWDNQNKKATIIKPNVHLVLFKDNAIFGKVSKGNKYTFNVFAQVDNLKTSISAVKVSIFDPYGNEKTIQSQTLDMNKDNFWYRTQDIQYSFDYTGKYAVRFFMKTSPDAEWTSVSEILISSET
ncbi:stalk domain-containing protein [Paenibacillus protaetiae]|uniref:Copper amine oxidase N-terminal domain-containing protein n=1 Tax=Paenibacillus protaetiae TaxID=2509456 RepID=A0A4P6ESS6_9BACL|nr:stalk domain-containing protein [Paenibacillus protaetiae]QAY65465.1 copper amine oxidase N-terminal domain-containing protein [Paenibacillus protaetiae]